MEITHVNLPTHPMEYVIRTIVRRCTWRIHYLRPRSHQKFAENIPLPFGLGYIFSKLPLASVSGSIFGIYTSSLWFIHDVSICHDINPSPQHSAG